MLPAPQLCLARPPVQSSGNHQVQDEPEFTFYANCDSFADSSQFADYSAFYTAKGWLNGSEQKGARQPHSDNWLTDNARFKHADVSGDIGQFRHATRLQRPLSDCNRGFRS
jgi:hypothetical protein